MSINKKGRERINLFFIAWVFPIHFQICIPRCVLEKLLGRMSEQLIKGHPFEADSLDGFACEKTIHELGKPFLFNNGAMLRSIHV
jgi:hypothetical protein